MKLTADYTRIRLAEQSEAALQRRATSIFHHALKIALGQSTLEQVPEELKKDVQTAASSVVVSDSKYYDARGYTRKDFDHAAKRIYEAENKVGGDYDKFTRLIRSRLNRMKNQSKVRAFVHALEDQNYHDLAREVREKIQ